MIPELESKLRTIERDWEIKLQELEAKYKDEIMAAQLAKETAESRVKELEAEISRLNGVATNLEEKVVPMELNRA